MRLEKNQPTSLAANLLVVFIIRNGEKVGFIPAFSLDDLALIIDDSIVMKTTSNAHHMTRVTENCGNLFIINNIHYFEFQNVFPWQFLTLGDPLDICKKKKSLHLRTLFEKLR